MKLLPRFSIMALIVLGSVCLDQYTKMAAQSSLRGKSSKSYLDGVFHFVYAENTGAMLSIGSALPESFRFVLFEVLVSLAIAAAIIYVLLKPLRATVVVAMSLVIGGGASNVIDRLVHNGSVIDFMVVKIDSFESGIFNMADLAIILGLCILSGCIFCFKKDKQVDGN